MIKDRRLFSALRNRLDNLLNEQLILIYAKYEDTWNWWKSRNLKEPDYQIENLEEKIEQNRLSILATINEIENLYFDDVSVSVYEQAELIFRS